MKFKDLKNGLSVSLSGNLARASFRAAIPEQRVDDAAKEVLSKASLYYDFRQQRAAVADNIEVPQSPSLLADERYVYPNFRALSQTHLVERGLDFSTPGVLEAAVPLLFGKTIYLNHEFTDVNEWVGVISKSSWDAAGEKSGGTPGIAVQCKVDAYLNYRIACGLMMRPPAINAMSLTVLFEFEYSHPEMAMENKWKFFENLGEEIDGQIVRLIVTKIVEIWEASFVYVGEDRLAKNHGDDAGEESFSADEAEPAADEPPPNSTAEEKTMKLTAEQKKSLGIEFDGEEVPETELLKAAESLAGKLAKVDTVNMAELEAKAADGEKYVELQRAEVTRLAKLAELGADKDGELDAVIADDIKAASFDRLTKLTSFYQKKVADKFPAGGRSSEEESLSVDKAGGADENTADLPEAGLL